MKKMQAKKIQKKSLNWFSERMLEKLMDRLEKNDGNPLLGKEKDHNVWFYFKRMLGETKKLQCALGKNDFYDTDISKQVVIRGCCDVANFAAAIAEMMRDFSDE